MSGMEVNGFDIFVAVVLVLSTLIAFLRGFVRETLTLFAWIGAGFAAYFGHPYLMPLLKEHIASETLAKGVAITGIFVVSLLLIAVINLQIVRMVKDLNLGTLDRSMGILFGLLRGGVIVSLFYLLGSLMIFGKDKPEWFQQARSSRMVEMGSEVLAELAPKVTQDLREAGKEMREENAQGTAVAEADLTGMDVAALTPSQQYTLRRIVMSIPPSMLPPGGVDRDAPRSNATQMLDLVRIYKDLKAKNAAIVDMAEDVTPSELASLEKRLRQMERAAPKRGVQDTGNDEEARARQKDDLDEFFKKLSESGKSQ